MFQRLLAGGLTCLAVLACTDEPWPDPPDGPLDAFVAEFDEWRQDRRDRLVTPPSGAVLWIGLWELSDGSTPFGSDSTLAVVLPSSEAPPLAGVLHKEGERVRLEPAPGVPLRDAEDRPIAGPVELAHDRSEDPTTVKLGSLGMRIHSEQGTSRLWLRAWDEEHPERDAFELPETFRVDTLWRVAARFEAFPEPIALRVADVTGGIVEQSVPGELVFRLGGREHRLLASADSTSTTFFVTLWDSTAATSTYEAGRYLRTPLPDDEGWTEIDFNRAYNPPCVFTPYSVCSLPPPQNRLPLAVPAGEKRP